MTPRRAIALCLLATALAGCAATKELTAPLTPGPPKPTIDIEGVSGDLAENVRAHLALAQEPCDAPHWRVRVRFEHADGDVRAALQAFGYYHPRIEKSFQQTESCWRATFHIQPGEPVRIKRVEVRLRGAAADDPKFQALLKTLPIREGMQLNHGDYEAAKQAITSLAAERGYFDGTFKVHRLAVDPDLNQASIDLEYDSGPRYRFGELRVHQDILKPELVQRFIHIHPGDPYQGAELAALNSALVNSRYFVRADIRPRREEAHDGEVPIDIDLVPSKRHSFSFGVGAATDTGPRVKVGYANRRLNRSGHRLSSHAQASFLGVEFGVQYQIPLADPRTEWLSFQSGYKTEETNNRKSKILTGGVNRTHLRFGSWLETESLDYERERFKVGGENDISHLLIPGLSWTQTVADDPVRPHRGWRARFAVQGAYHGLVSDLSFIQGQASGKWIRTVPWQDRVLMRAQVGATGVSDFARLPVSKRFFAGGDNSVRGYGYQDLGPRNDQGDVVGGRYLLVGSFEYEHPLTDRWSVAAFIDSGNAFDNLRDIDLKLGVGPGIRWRSPIGLVRLDLGFPIDDPNRVIRLHFTMGPDL
jgi:translocation and assembly module TamA